MREIKFRAWDRKYKKMIYFNDHKIGILYQWNRFMVSSGWDNEDNPTFEKNTSDRYIIMQFTGLYDSTKWEELSEKEKEFWVRQGYKKNNWKGKEIYEGDIVRVVNTRKKLKAVCEWGEMGQITGWLFRPLKPLISGVREYFNPEMCVFEVIGNRWENPELLEAKDERD